jgi:FKBP-type peptidyl-prolyl cis-trans isomerase FkpA
MKYHVLLFSCFIYLNVNSAPKDSSLRYPLPDSVKAMSFLADINVRAMFRKEEVDQGIKKNIFAGIKTQMVSLALETDKNKRQIVFHFPKSASVMSSGLAVDKSKKDELIWNYNWNEGETYKLMLAVATDSAGNFSLYSSYIWLPQVTKWKLIGTCKISRLKSTMKDPSWYYSAGKRSTIDVTIDNAWIQRDNGTWRKLDGNKQSIPVVNLVSHVDSLKEFQLEKEQIEKAISAGTTDVKENIGGVYYKIYNEGSGRQVSVTDSVTVYYKGYLFNNGEVFDETKDKPATFPLNRLIKGWQIGLPLLKTGGKIKLVIPSALAYSIRPRASKIPPNSILVFEIEVVDAK